MTVTEQIVQALRTLPEAQAREVLDFVLLKSRLLRATSSSNQPDMSAFDRFGRYTRVALRP